MKKRMLAGVGLLFLIALSGCASSESAPKIPVLMYHHISENEQDWSNATISPEKFKEDMLYIKTLGFETILSEDLVNFKEKGTPLPTKPIMITFDDGYRSNYTYAFPILKELNMKATINVIVSTVGRDTSLEGTPITPHFSWVEAKEMMDSDLIDIGHHTYDLHLPGNGKYGKGVAMLKDESMESYIARLKTDLLLGEREIVEHLGKKPIVFAYPYGVFTEASEDVLKELGYNVTLTVQNGASTIGENFYLLKRINMPQSKESPVLMKTLLNALNQKTTIPFEEMVDPNDRIRALEKQAEASF